MTRGKKSKQQERTRPAAVSRAAAKSPRKRAPARTKHERPAQPAGASRGIGRFPIVGIGASAGGLEAFGQLLEHLKPDTGMGFVYVQHLDPHHDSMLTELLAKSAGMPVQEARDGMPVRPNHIYVIAPNTSLGIGAGKLEVRARSADAKPHMAIDHFLGALAHDRGNQAIGIILSGTATDGTIGLQTIKHEGGITFAQAPESAKYEGMPRSAIASGCVDFVQSPMQIAGELRRLVRHPYLSVPAHRQRPEESHEDLTTVFRTLRLATGVDFTHYKTSTIKRRIVRRMMLNKLDSIAAYARLVEHTPAEVESLYQDLLINVTSFFRDPAIGETLASKVLPRLLERRDNDQPLRIWVPGCASGEEVYSLAMTIIEVLGDQRTPLQIFGTDVSDTALDKARPGIYSANQLADVSRERLRRFFVKIDGGFQIKKEVRDACLFARQDLSRDPPFSRLDLISCRNVLIYMEAALQKRIVATFHYALNPGGVLVLGSSETIGSNADLFNLLDKQSKIYQKKSSPPVGGPRQLVNFAAPGLGGRHGAPARPAAVEFPSDPKREADRIVLARYAPASVLINESLDILQFRGRTGEYLEPSAGSASLNLLKMAREGLITELRRTIQRARRRDAATRSDTIPISSGDRTQLVSVEVTPVNPRDSKERYFLITFDSKTPNDRTEPSRRAKRPSSTAVAQRQTALEQELAATREYLQSTVEAHEATNEELRSVLEEVQSSYEEMQSVNEELETAKEELQSMNEELTTLNEELQNRNSELNVLNNDLTNLLTGVHMPLVMVNDSLRIRRFTAAAEKIFGLIPTDIGRPLSDLRLNQLVPKLDEIIHDVMTSLRPMEFEVEHGRWYSLRVRPYKTLDNKIEGAVLTFVDIHDMRRDLIVAEDARDYAQAIVEFVQEPLLVLGTNLGVHSASPAYYRMFSAVAATTEGRMLFELEHGRWDHPPLRDLMQQLLKGERRSSTVEINAEFPGIGRRRLRFKATATKKSFILLAIEDLQDSR